MARRPNKRRADVHLGGLDSVRIDVGILGASLAPLTEAEREVALLAVEGLSNAEIAKRRGATAKTVANQLARIYVKLGVRSRFELVSLLASE